MVEISSNTGGDIRRGIPGRASLLLNEPPAGNAIPAPQCPDRKPHRCRHCGVAKASTFISFTILFYFLSSLYLFHSISFNRGRGLKTSQFGAHGTVTTHTHTPPRSVDGSWGKLAALRAHNPVSSNAPRLHRQENGLHCPLVTLSRVKNARHAPPRLVSSGGTEEAISARGVPDAVRG